MYTEINDFTIESNPEKSSLSVTCVHAGQSIQLTVYRETGVVEIVSDAEPAVETEWAGPAGGFNTIINVSGKG